MANVSGQLFFDVLRTATVSGAGMTGIPNVPIVLQNLDDGDLLAVLTSASGNYSFINVPAGNYQIVESFGTPATLVGTGDFTLAVPEPLINGGTVPPISYVASPPVGATNLDCTIPNTRLVTVVAANLTAQNFLNGPVLYAPLILESGIFISPDNLITGLGNGTFGSFPAGTAANTGANPNPYPDIESDFIFVQPNPAVVTPNDGQYTIQNLMNNAHTNTVGTWWRIADHTTGNETGRMMFVNGADPGAAILSQTVPVKMNTDYLFSTWVLNLIKRTPGYANPEFAIEVYDQNGEILFFENFANEIPVNAVYPEWLEIGTIVNTGNNSSITVRLISTGPGASGNDYVIDDIGLFELVTPSIVKTVIKSKRCEIFTFCNMVTNPTNEEIIDSVFRDRLNVRLCYVKSSFRVNGEPQVPSITNNTIEYVIPSIGINQTIRICFKACIMC